MGKRHQRWSRERQIASEKPPEPLLTGCTVHEGKRTMVLCNGRLVCLWCDGCTHCGSKISMVESYEDSDLFDDPIRLGTRIIRGDWVCWTCSQTLVDWSGWRRRTLAWRRGQLALREGYRRGRFAA